MKPLFTDTPEAWTRTRRVSESPAEYATAIEPRPSGTAHHPADYVVAAMFVAVLLAVLFTWG